MSMDHTEAPVDQSDADWTAKALCKALADRDEERFRTIAFWKRHTIIEALEAVAAQGQS